MEYRTSVEVAATGTPLAAAAAAVPLDTLELPTSLQDACEMART